MSDLDQMLESLGQHGPKAAPEPPPEFLAAVGRRRRQRRIRGAASVAAAIALVAAVAVVMGPWRPVPDAPVRGHGAAMTQPDSLLALTQLNPELSTEGLRLPASSPSGGDIEIQLGMRWEPAQIEQWVGR